MNKQIKDMEQREIISYIKGTLNDELKQIRKRLIDENTKRQFDYVTSPSLANAVDETENILKDILKIVYQE